MTFSDILHSHELKSTPLRLGVLEVLNHVHNPMTAEEITQALPEISFDRATLFRCLKSFTEKGLLHSVDLGEGFLRYERNCDVHHHHHHIRCTLCKSIEIVPFCIPESILKHLKNKGYKEVTHRMDFSGTCSRCS